jgi:membrane protein DedA with SNARE-associated domain
MSWLRVNPRSAWIAALLVCLACACGVTVAHAAGSKSGENVAKESLQAFEKQLAAGEVKSAALKTKRHLLHVKLADGRHLTVEYTKSAGRVRSELVAHGVTLPKVKAPAHKTRYIVGGALVVVLILVLAGLLLWRRRRSAALDEY